MKILVTYWNGLTNRARFFNTTDEAQNFIWVCRKMRPEYDDFKIENIED
jgi:hypothetical protein